MSGVGEFQLGNLPLILIAITLICLGVLGFFEFKKIFVKLNILSSKIDELNEKLLESRKQQPVVIPPHILQQQHEQMLMRKKQELLRQQQREEIYYREQGERKSKDYDEEYDEEYENASKDNESLSDNNSEIIENEQTDDKKSYSESSSEEDNSDNSDEDNNEDEITIELDNKYKHLSVKELKELCKENNLKISGNKSKLISRLLKIDE